MSAFQIMPHCLGARLTRSRLMLARHLAHHVAGHLDGHLAGHVGHGSAHSGLPRTGKGERGSTAVELLLMAPLLMGLVLMVVAAGRYVESRGQVNDSAYDAARAAVIQSNFTAARSSAFQAAKDSLANRGKACVNLDVSFAGTDFEAGGTVKVTVTCTADLEDVIGFDIPGHKTFTSTAVVPIEQWRDISDGFTNASQAGS